MACKSNHWANDFTGIGFQVIVNFGFLIVFVLTYGQTIKREETSRQIADLVDTVMSDLTMADYVQLTGGETPAKMEAGITHLQSIINTRVKANHDEFQKNNNEVWKKSLILYGGISAGIIGIMLVLRLGFGYCLNIKYGFLKAIVATIFIALTEILLVNVNLAFIPYSRTTIKKAVGQAITTYADDKLAALAV